MLPEERKLLEKSVSLAEDSNKILHSMRRSMFWGRIVKTIYWVLIIGSVIGAYYFIQPYVDKVIGVYNAAQGNIQNVNNIINSFKK